MHILALCVCVRMLTLSLCYTFTGNLQVSQWWSTARQRLALFHLKQQQQQCKLNTCYTEHREREDSEKKDKTRKSKFVTTFRCQETIKCNFRVSLMNHSCHRSNVSFLLLSLSLTDQWLVDTCQVHKQMLPSPRLASCASLKYSFIKE